MLRRTIQGGLFTFFLAACSPGTGDMSSLKLDILQDAWSIGSGYNQVTRESRGTCVSFENPRVTSQKTQLFKVRPIRGYSDLANSVGMNLADFLRQNKDDRRQILQEGLDFHPRYLNLLVEDSWLESKTDLNQSNPTLTRAANSQFDNKNYATFLASCGDNFVGAIQNGDFHYTMLSVVVQGEEQKKNLAKEASEIKNPEALIAWLKTKPLVPAQGIVTLELNTLADAHSSDPLKPFYKLSDFVSYYRQFQGSRSKNGLFPLVVERISYLDISEQQPEPALDRATEVNSYLELFNSLELSKLVFQTTRAVKVNPKEFNDDTSAISIKDLGELEATLNESIAQCQEECSDIDCSAALKCSDIAASNLDEKNLQSLMSALPMLVKNGPALKDTDSIIYLGWLSNREEWGAMKELSKVSKGSLVTQEFANRIAFQLKSVPLRPLMDQLLPPNYQDPSPDYPSFTGIGIQPQVFKRWEENLSDLSIPVLTTKLNADTEITSFINVQDSSRASLAAFYYQKASAPNQVFRTLWSRFFLGDQMPIGDELAKDFGQEKRVVVETETEALCGQVIAGQITATGWRNRPIPDRLVEWLNGKRQGLSNCVR